jgi:DNA-binding beta-propeller fold protein YncE
VTHHLTDEQYINYIYQLLPDTEREEIDQHLSACPVCRTSLAEYETLQRRIHYSVAGRRRITPFSRMNYAAIAPRLKSTRRITGVLKQSKQFVYGTLTTALLVAVVVGLYFFVSNLSRPMPITSEEVKPATSAPTLVKQVEVRPTAAVKPTGVVSQPTTSPTSEVSQPLANPVEFVMSITGEPNPLAGPTHVAVDLEGNLYVIDATNNRIQKFDRTGQFLTMWGRLGSGEGEFNFHVDRSHGGVAVDGQGQVYVVDQNNKRIQKFDSNGRFLAKWDSRGMKDGQFIRPSGIAVDRQGYVYVVDGQRNDIQKFDGNGQFLAKWGSLGSGDGQFKQPWGVEVDGAGNIFVVDRGNFRIQKFDQEGQFLAQWGSSGSGEGQFLQPNDLSVDSQGQVYVPDEDSSTIQIFDGQGQFLARWGSFGRGEGQFIQPGNVAVDQEGYIYVVDHGNNRVQKFRLK